MVTLQALQKVKVGNKHPKRFSSVSHGKLAEMTFVLCITESLNTHSTHLLLDSRIAE